MAKRRWDLREGEQILREWLAENNKDGHLTIDLDEDDILNYKDTIKRLKLGIDTTYLVKHFGQDTGTETEPNRETLQNCEYIEEDEVTSIA